MKTIFTFLRPISILCIILFNINVQAQRISTGQIKLPESSILNSPKTANDTLLPGNAPNLVNPIFVMYRSDNGGYVLGTNGFNDRCKCQQYKVTFPYHIEGAIYWFGYKYSQSGGLLKFAIWNMDSLKGTTHDTTNQICPGTVFVSITDTISKIDTSSFLSQAYVVSFPFPVLVLSDYCIGFDMKDIADDSIALVSTSQGQGGNLELVWEQWNNGSWYTLQGAQWNYGIMDIDAMILPIIDNTAGCIEDEEFISGVKLNPAYPNPCFNECTFSYQLENNQRAVSINILNSEGKLIYSKSLSGTSKGIHQFSIDVSGFRNGTYYYILNTSESRIAKKMVIGR